MTTAEQTTDWVDALDYPWPTGPYIPHEPEVAQDAFLWYQGMEALYGGAAGGGKAKLITTPIPTPNGWTTMGELRKGDELFDEHGNVIQVLQVHPINPKPESYKLTFDDGTTDYSDAGHRWLTYDTKELSALTRTNPEWRASRRAKRSSRAKAAVDIAQIPYGRCKCGCGQATSLIASSNAGKGLVRGEPRGYTKGHAPASPLLKKIISERNKREVKCGELPKGTIRTTKEIFETLKTSSGRANHAIPVAGPLQLEDANLPMDPYLLGLWLGDGSAKSAVYASADPELPQAFEDAGFIVRHARDYSYYVYGIRKELRKVGVFGNKHIPSEYLRGSYEQRLALLQGLMDTDGTCGKSGLVTFSNTNENLTKSVAELARSLGSKCTINFRMPKIDGSRYGRNGTKYKKAYTVKWSPDYPVFRLKRKLDRQKIGHRRTTKFHYIVNCQKIDPVPMRCITVSSQSGLFLAGENMVPTHNSDALLMAALQYVDVPGYAALLLRKTYVELTLENALLDRSMKWLSHTDASWNGEHRRWTFPSGATLTFGFLQKSQDRARYQSAEFQFIGFDELTQFEETDYRFMFSRLRKVSACPRADDAHLDENGYSKARGKWVGQELRCDICGGPAAIASLVPTRMRAATNPGGPGHKWVHDRFIKPWEFVQAGGEPNPNRIFIPAKLSDNPHVDQASYRQALEELEPELAQQLLEGDWNAREPGFWMMRDPRWIDSCVELGRKLWDDHVSGNNPLPPPRVEYHGKVREALANSIDWGEHTHSYVIWPLPNGGIFIPPSEVVMIGRDPADTTRRILEVAMAFEYPLVITYYDAAGVQSMRTYLGVLRRVPRFRWNWSRGIPFKDYKKETIGFLRVLARRTFRGESVRVLAIHPDNVELIRQLKGWKRKTEESDEAVKKDDHGPDALVAGVASIAREYRQFVEKELQEALKEDLEPYEIGVIEQGGVAYVS